MSIDGAAPATPLFMQWPLVFVLPYIRSQVWFFAGKGTLSYPPQVGGAGACRGPPVLVLQPDRTSLGTWKVSSILSSPHMRLAPTHFSRSHHCITSQPFYQVAIDRISGGLKIRLTGYPEDGNYILTAACLSSLEFIDIPWRWLQKQVMSIDLRMRDQYRYYRSYL